jgi:prepilin-type N-terminal cleavage/methylation domain-containing protein
MKKNKRGFTLSELLVALMVIGLAVGSTVYMRGVDSINQAKVQTARQQAKQIQTALETWILEQPTISGARVAFNANPAATTPADHGAFFNANLVQYLDAGIGADISAKSNAARINSTVLQAINANITLYWDTNYTQQHAKVILTIP